MTHILRINEMMEYGKKNNANKIPNNKTINESYGSGALNDIDNGYSLYLFYADDLELKGMDVNGFLSEYREMYDQENSFGFFVLENQGKYTFIVSMKNFIGRRSNPREPVDFALINLVENTDIKKPEQIEKFINEYCVEWVKPNEFVRKWLPKFENMTSDDICGEEILMKNYFYN